MTEVLDPKEVEAMAKFVTDLLIDERTPDWIRVKIVDLMINEG